MSAICRFDHNNDGDCHIHPRGCPDEKRADGGGRPYYEMHITFLGDPLPEGHGWSQSEIAGDIILGDGPKRYLTDHADRHSDPAGLARDMERIADDLRASGRKVLRTKIELVLYDRRTP